MFRFALQQEPIGLGLWISSFVRLLDGARQDGWYDAQNKKGDVT
jgi:hypothetical protein